MTYRVKYLMPGAALFSYTDGFDTRDEAERWADDLADAQYRVVSIEEGSFPTTIQLQDRIAAEQAVKTESVRQRIRRGEMRGPRDFGPPRRGSR